ncbi:MAG: hypothetical protein OXF73_02250 [Gammaproteobacteria bacterium]|nr:hypothetical protein [Gammaproteobacteria bacterium]MCY4226592.1 hypothetical protein [Gammaproteobacteria bacterium]
MQFDKQKQGCLESGVLWLSWLYRYCFKQAVRDLAGAVSKKPAFYLALALSQEEVLD